MWAGPGFHKLFKFKLFDRRYQTQTVNISVADVQKAAALTQKKKVIEDQTV